MTNDVSETLRRWEAEAIQAAADREELIALRQAVADWMAYADKLEALIELTAGQAKDQLKKLHAEQGLRIVRPDFNPEQGT